jgi:PAS domain S-box-containing protein
MKHKANRLALRISLIYCFVAALWILLTDWLMMAFVHNPGLIGKISIFKGLAFVAATSPLLYFALRKQLRRWEHEAGARIQAEDKVRQLSQAVEQSPVSIVITDTSGKIEYVNQKFTEVTGYSFKEAAGKNPRILKSGELSAETYKELWDTITSGKTWSGEFHNRAKNGELFWELANISPIFGADDKATHFLAVKEDITRRKQVEAALREREEQLHLFVKHCPASIAMLDHEMKYLVVSRRWMEDYRLGDQSIIGRSHYEVFPEIPKQWIEIHLRCLAGAVEKRDEEPFLRKDGVTDWLRWEIRPWRRANGSIGGIIIFTENITNRKNASEVLRASEERFRLLTENASDLITVVNNKGVICFQSPSVEQILGYNVEEVINRNTCDFIHPEDISSVSAAFQRAMAGPDQPVPAEFRFRHHDGKWHILQSVAKSIPNFTSEGFIVVNSRNITENRKLEEQLRQSQKMEAIGQLAGGVAHDFNNILAVIQMQSDLLKNDGNLSPNQLDLARQIGATAQRGAALTHQLLLFSRKQVLQLRDLDLNQSINSMAKMLQRTLGEDIQLQFKFTLQPLIIHADPVMMDQVLMNLVVNSRDAMPKGGCLVIETSVVDFDELAGSQSPQARSGPFVCLSVSDTGSGIPPEILPHIFEPFFSTKSVGKGTGLGLATVFGIIQQHHGWINVYSEIGLGTTFRIYIPRLAKKPVQQSEQSESNSIRGGDETILLVEDDSFLRTSMRKALAQRGYHVLEAVNGIEALEIWKDHHTEIHLLLTDLIMPGGMTGKDLGEKLLKENPRLKVIYASGYSPEIAGKDFPLREGVNYLAKPFEASKLAQVVRKRIDANN